MKTSPDSKPRVTGLWIGVMAAVAAFLTTPARAHDGDHDHPPVRLAPETEHKPSVMPDRVILTWSEDPATTQDVTWRTDASVMKSVAQLVLADDGPYLEDKAKTLPAETQQLPTDLGPARYHTARFRTLTPNTKYAYRVGDGVNWSEWFHFQTAAAGRDRFSFVYFGDAQNDIQSLWSRIVRGAYSDGPARPRFIIHAGDLVSTGNADAQWGEWHRAAGWVNGMVPSLPAPGNHEYGRKLREDPKRLTEHWAAQFSLPTNGPDGLAESSYYLDYQGCRFVILNSNEKLEEQASWLDRILANNPNRWTILSFHHPVYSPAKERDNPTLRASWQPVIDRHKVDLVLNGHDHTYARTGMLSAVNVPTGSSFQSESGTVYVTSVSGPKMYASKHAQWMRRAAEDTQLYQIITIEGDRLAFEAKTATGALYDAFELTKVNGSQNRLTEPHLTTPERHRPDTLPESRRLPAKPAATAPGGAGAPVERKAG
jgi:3',5'-cyclic AMP phosphodiesterase CpdA